MHPNMEYCALHYLHQWITDERSLREALTNGDSAQVLHALSVAVKFFQVARNLPRKYDVDRGQKRYEPLLHEFQKLPSAHDFEYDYVDQVDQFQKHIGAQYGGRSLISLSSKLLWLRYRDPFIIYDSRVRKALGVASADYGEFASKWLKCFEAHRSRIVSVCNTLPSILRYLAAQSADMEEEVGTVISKPWFHRRVLDIYLWHEGG